MKRGFKGLVPLVAAAILCETIANVPSASAVTIDINTCWTECSEPPLPNVTVATLTFNNTVENTVQFTLTNTQSNLGAVSGDGAFISQLLLNYTGGSALTFTKIDFSDVSNEGSFAQGGLTNAGLSFNLELGLPNSNSGGGLKRFKDGESLVWTLSGIGVDASDFSTPTNSTLVHIQGVATEAGSTKYVNGGSTVPEPASVMLLGSGLVGIGLWGMKRRKNA